jgi:transposase
MKQANGYDLEKLGQLCSQATDRRTHQRLKAIHLRGEGKTLSEIALLLSCTPKTIRVWIKQFNAGGPEALKYRHTGGRAAKLNEEQEAALLAALQQGNPFGRRWTLKALAEKMLAEYGVSLSQQQIYERVRRHQMNHFLSKSARARQAADSAAAPTPARGADEKE